MTLIYLILVCLDGGYRDELQNHTCDVSCRYLSNLSGSEYTSCHSKLFIMGNIDVARGADFFYLINRFCYRMVPAQLSGIS